MITCDLMGRMGNQMFQIAATIAAARRFNMPYSIPIQTTRPDLWLAYFSDYFQEHGLPQPVRNFCEEKMEYQPIQLNSKCKTLKLSGYFQSEKYFVDCRKEIIEAFQFNWILLKDFVSIHVRRGDYLLYPEFPVLGIYYYRQAIEFFREKGYKNFFVFSDDMQWCRQNIHAGIFPECRFYYSEGESERSDMRLMSWCEHNITANSSFSWWGAWLNQNPNKTVIAPTRIFNLANKDMIPESWLRFKNE